MNERQIRPLTQDDFPELMRLEEEVFGASGESVLGPYYVRLCCEFFQETCFIAVEQGRAVGYVLCFVKGREAYCTTLAVAPELQGSRVAFQLLKALIGALVGRVDSCWFTVKEDNVAARSGGRARAGSRPARRGAEGARAARRRARGRRPPAARPCRAGLQSPELARSARRREHRPVRAHLEGRPVGLACVWHDRSRARRPVHHSWGSTERRPAAASGGERARPGHPRPQLSGGDHDAG